MALEGLEPGGLGLLQEGLVQGRIGQGEGHVHPRPALGVHRVVVEVRGVDGGIELARLALVDLGHLPQPATALEPLEHQPGQVPGIGGRGVVHGAGLGVHRVVQHGGHAGQGPAHQVLAYDDHGQAGGPDVLLRPGVDHAVAGHVDGAREDGGRHVRHQRDATGIRDVGKLHSADGLVGRVVHVGRIGGQVQPLLPRHGGEVVGLGAAGDAHLAEAARLLDGLLRPRAGVDVVGGFLPAQQVDGHHGELEAGPALQEQDLVAVRHRQQVAQVGLGLLGDGDEGPAAVAHLHHRHAFAVPVQQLLACLLQHLFRQRRRSGAEVVCPRHGACVFPLRCAGADVSRAPHRRPRCRWPRARCARCRTASRPRPG